MAFEYLESATKKVWKDFDLEDIIIEHNKNSDSSLQTSPLSSKDVGKVSKPKTGFGAVLNVQVKSKRDIVASKIFDTLSSNNEEIKNIFRNAFEENNQSVEIEDIQLIRDQGWSAGSKTILMNMFTYNKQGIKSRNPQRFVIAFKGLKNDSTDPHELMTAALIRSSTIVNVQTYNNISDVVERESKLESLTEQIAQSSLQVIGSKKKESDAIKGDYANLAKAISVSNYIVGVLNKYNYKIENVYQTGAAWASKVRPFQGFNAKQLKSQDYIIKSYNSADLIVEFTDGNMTHFWGLSLKKKGIGKNEPDPTLLNKPVSGKGSFNSKTGKGTRDGYLTYKLGEESRNLITAEENFWKEVYKVKMGRPPTGTRATWLKQLDGLLSGDEKNAALTGKEYVDNKSKRIYKYPKNTYFEEIDKSFKKVFSKSENFREFMDIVFRINIDSYVNNKQFHFSLITGSGDYKPDGKLVVNNANEKSSVLMNAVFAKLFGRKGLTDRDYKVMKTSGKPAQAFEPNAKAAKLFYTLWIKNMPLVDLEVRYKGAITNNPQFQVFITTKFSGYLDRVKRMLGSKHAFAK